MPTPTPPARPLRFDDLALSPALLDAVRGAGWTTPTPIQAAAIPVLLAGRDLCATAQTGTGKTAAFALPILQRLASSRNTGAARALVLSPTRELAIQIGETFRVCAAELRGFRHSVVYGGMKDRAQKRAISAGIDVLVATPGRLLDLCGQGALGLRGVECFVLDEADRMLDMGFIEDVRRIVRLLPPRRQTALFSATLPPEIEDLASRLLHDPARVSVAPVSAVAERIDERVYLVEKPEKRALLQRLLEDTAIARSLVFVRTKKGADKLAHGLREGGVRAEAIHSDRPQAARERALADFRRGATRVLVATDIAARGIDVEGITHVVNYDIPPVAETYVHRIGRTARAGAAGVAISLCSLEEREYLYGIHRLKGQKIPVVTAPTSSPVATG